MNDSGKIVRAFELDFQTNIERLLHQRRDVGVGRVNVLHEQFGVIDCIGERDHPRGENIVWPEFAGFHHDESAGHVRHQSGHLRVISNIIAR